MKSRNGESIVLVVKDESNERQIPSVWRPIFCDIVKAFVERDYRLSAGIAGVAPVTVDTAKQIEEYIQDYGETLSELPPAAWDTSVSLWTGTRWDVLIDLWTEGEGCSDMVLSVHVSELENGFEFEVYMLYVP